MVIETLGRSFLRGEVGRDEPLARTRDFEASQRLFPADMSNWAYDVRLVEGDLDIDGPFHLFTHKLAGLVVTAGWLSVGGSLLVHGGLVGDHNDCSAMVRGQTRARRGEPVLVEDGDAR